MEETEPVVLNGVTYNIYKPLADRWVEVLGKFQKENPCPWAVPSTHPETQKIKTTNTVDINKDYDLISPAIFNEQTQKWEYGHIDGKTRLSGDAMTCGVSRKVMEEIEYFVSKAFPVRDDEHSNKPIYSSRQVNQMIRFAVAQNCKKILVKIKQ